MKLWFAIFISALALSAQDSQAPQKQAAPTPRPKAAASAVPAVPKVTDGSKPMPIPATAVLGADGDFHYTDAQGKNWIYRKTPFGVTRLEDSPERTAAQAAAASGAGIKATEDGDVVHFERKGPFGLWKWDKKKSDLDEGEKAALKNSQTNDSTVSKQD
jgi:hypothetical protein